MSSAGGWRAGGGGGKRRGGWKGFKKRLANPLDATNERESVESTRKQRLKDKIEIRNAVDKQDQQFGFDRVMGGPTREGWILNLVPTVMVHSDSGAEQSACDVYLIDDSGGQFKATVVFCPYFYVCCREDLTHSMEDFLTQKYEAFLDHIELVDKVDLDLKNHLSGLTRTYLKLVFKNDYDLKQVLRELQREWHKNRAKSDDHSVSSDVSSSSVLSSHNSRSRVSSGPFGAIFGTHQGTSHSSHRVHSSSMTVGSAGSGSSSSSSLSSSSATVSLSDISDIREYDVPYITRLCIDMEISVGKWYQVTPALHGTSKLSLITDKNLPPEVRVLAFDIETSKQPLKFPNAEFDEIMMISYMLNRNEGFLIVNRSIVSEDIEDFEYNPKPGQIEGYFTIFNERDELGLLHRFFEHIREYRPHVYVSYNGDFFDWPFIEQRTERLGLCMDDEIGVSNLTHLSRILSRNKESNDSGKGSFSSKSSSKKSNNGKRMMMNAEYGGRFAIHLDCFAWVQRDSYLPQGSQNLKAVTKKKLKYNPVELDPELMTPYAQEKPHELATYSVSDAVATYYLFKKYVESFIFSLCNIIPMTASDVLRKGSGTLCESLLMIRSKEGNIIAPNKQVSKELQFYSKPANKLSKSQQFVLESETYIGGHVEAFECGIFRSDIPVEFVIESDAYQELIDELHSTLKFAIEIELKLTMKDVRNYDDIYQDIRDKLLYLKHNNRFLMEPLIYHLDVSAMYPNIILTNRLQPVAVVNEEICAACDFNHNQEENNCQRRLNWKWRGKYYPTTRGEYRQIRNQLEYERIEIDHDDDDYGDNNQHSSSKTKQYKTFGDLDKNQQISILKSRLKSYSQRVYKCQTIEEEREKSSIICQRENGFYVDTVQMFRDRRYKYKKLVKQWNKKKHNAGSMDAKLECERMVTLYDSMQLAHKCILNSFYGYVMRRGARWYSMDMAAITTHIGGNVIKDACVLCERIGRPLELDTDGIWTLLPQCFPECYTLKDENDNVLGKLEYPCSMLNIRTHQRYTNHQYQTLDPSNHNHYIKHPNHCTIFFELDGPYKAMILPASTEEGRKLKKRYCVFDNDHKISELKGFEIKRRGELQMIKIFQEEVFYAFLRGNTLFDIYHENVAQIGKRWLNIIDNKGMELSDDELFELITESKNMSKSVMDYGDQKSTSVTCARRLSEFLGDSFLKDSGLACKFIISLKPIGSPVSERAVPVDIFQADRLVMRNCLKRWLNDSSLTDFDVRSILDWDYYRKRVGQNIQKIITIPAAMQNISNPIPNLEHPPWLERILKEKMDPFKQKKITSFFGCNNDQKKKNENDQKKQPSLMDSDGRMNEDEGKKDGDSTTTKSSIGNDFLQSVKDDVTSSLKSNAAKARTKSGLVGDEDEHIDEHSIVNVTADIDDDFKQWHRQTKKLWKKQRAENKVRRKMMKMQMRRMDENSKKRNHESMLSSDDHHHSSSSRVTPLGSRTVQSFVQKRLDVLYHSVWQIVQIVPLDSPGKYHLWCLCSGDKSLRKIALQVQRQFYVNVIKPSGVPYLMANGTKCKRILPRNRPKFTLIKVQMNESDFVRDSKKIGMFITSAYIEGVYETNVPLLFRVISTLGCCCKVDRSVVTRVRASHGVDGFHLDELQFVPVAKQSYLEDRSLRFMFLFVSLSRHGSPQRGIVGLFIPDLRSKKKKKKNEEDDEQDELPSKWILHVACANPRGGPIENAKLQKYLQQLSEQMNFLGNDVDFHHSDNDSNNNVIGNVIVDSEDEQSSEDDEKKTMDEDECADYDCDRRKRHRKLKITLEESRHISINEALNKIGDRLNDYRHSVYGRSTIVMVQSAFELSELQKKMPILKEEFASITVPFCDEDDWQSYPSLQWYTKSTRLMCDQFVKVPSLLSFYLNISRYSHIPIGNLNSSNSSTLDDLWINLCDTFMSRLCEDSKIVLWVSEGSRPDLGGLEADDNAFEDEEQLNNPIINRNGAYFSYCVEIKLKYLTINAISQSEHIHSFNLDRLDEYDGLSNHGNDAAMQQHNHHNDEDEKDGEQFTNDEIIIEKAGLRVDDAHSTKSVFRLVKKLVRKWLEIIVNKHEGCELADQCLMEVYRWIKSSRSRMYDPLLHRMVHSIVVQLFHHLIRYLSDKLGCLVVFASFDTIVIDTRKHNLKNSISYVKSMIRSISQMPMFNLLKLDVQRIYRCLLWYDQANYGGIKVTIREDLSDSPETRDPFDPRNLDFPLDSQWNIASFLPEIAEDYFLDTVGTYLEMVRNTLDDYDEQQSGDHSSETATKCANRRRDWIQSNLSQNLLRCVSELKKRDRGDLYFPERPGLNYAMVVHAHSDDHHPSTSSHRRRNVALELIKCISCVLSLDRQNISTVFNLRSDLLRLLKVTSFDESAEFVDPCLTFVLSDVTCVHCKQSRDVDLCRDQFVKPDVYAQRPFSSSDNGEDNQNDNPDGSEDDHNSDGHWSVRMHLRCDECSKPYDSDLIESMLLEIVRRKVSNFNAQDLVCKRCRQPKLADMCRHCSDCSAEFVPKLDADSFVHQLRILQNIARFYRFDFLSDSLSFLLRGR